MKNQGYLKLGLVIGLLLVLTGARSAPAASVTGCGTWRVIQSPNPTPTVILSGVAAISANNVWAVGRFTSDSNPSPRALALQWDGTHWQVGALPNPGTTEDAFLAVTRVSASQELWAVGYENSSPSGLHLSPRRSSNTGMAQAGALSPGRALGPLIMTSQQ